MINDLIDAVISALENMDKQYCKLSQIDYSKIEKINDDVREKLIQEKYLERPFAYEFYHQFRQLMDEGCIDFGGPIIQPEVDKRYQHVFEKGKIPDFIIHVPNKKKNLGIIEFKLATNLSESELKYDLKKLIKFMKNRQLRYQYGIEVIIGNTDALENVNEEIISKLECDNNGYKISIITFNTDTWTTSCYTIKYKSQLNINGS